MKCRVLCVQGYNYTSKKTGELKTGKTMWITTPDRVCSDDGHGNFTYGCPCESILIPASLNWSELDLKCLEDKLVDLIYDRVPGQKFDTLVDIQEVEA